MASERGRLPPPEERIRRREATAASAPPTRRIAPIRARASSPLIRINAEDAWLFGASLLGWLAVAVALEYGLGVTHPDSLARTVNALMVVASRDPHLGAIGFVWPPIPTLVRVALLPLFRPLGLTEFVGAAASIPFAAGCVVMLNRILRDFHIEGRARAAWLALTFANPLVALHFANGTAESAFALCLLIGLRAVTQLNNQPTGATMRLSIAIALSLWVRYEGVALAAVGLVTVVLAEWARKRAHRTEERERVASMAVLYLAPIVTVIAIWLSFSYTVQGDAFFFYRSEYSVQNAPEVARNDPANVLAFAYGSPIGSLRYVITRSLYASVAYAVGVLAVAWLILRRRDLRALQVLMMSGAIVALQAYQGFSGTIPPFLRYWVYLPVLAIPLLGYATMSAAGTRLGRRHRTPLLVAIGALIALSSSVSLLSMRDPDVGIDEQIVARSILGEPTEQLKQIASDRTTARAIADDLDARDGLILVDLDRASEIILLLDRPSRLVVNPDRDFQALVADPVSNGVSWVLLPDPAGRLDSSLARDSVYRVYPRLYDGAPWLELERQFEGETNWRLYRVIAEPGPAS